jgi:hypothetical protein
MWREYAIPIPGIETNRFSISEPVWSVLAEKVSPVFAVHA